MELEKGHQMRGFLSIKILNPSFLKDKKSW